MALSGCYAVLKYLLLIVNLLLWVVGLGVLSVAVWMLTDKLYVSMAQSEERYFIVTYVILGAGVLMAIVGFLGCCGAYRESQCLLVSYFFFVFIILVAKIAAGAWAYSNTEHLEEMLRDSVTETVESEYGVIDSRTTTFDTIQSGLECCGATGPSNWARSAYNGAKDKSSVELTFSAAIQTYKIPPSCCRYEKDNPLCKEASKIAIASIISDAMYNEGCIDKLMQYLKEQMTWVLLAGITIVVIDVLGLIFSMVLCCAIRGMDRYKA